MPWKIGSGRKKRMYVTAQIMRHNVPDMSIECLIFCLVYERFYYYCNTDDKLDNDFLLQTAENAFIYNLDLRQSKHPSYSVNKQYWAALGLTANQAKQIVGRQIRESRILGVYDLSKSVKENLDTMHSMGIKVGRSTLFKLISEIKKGNTGAPN